MALHAQQCVPLYYADCMRTHSYFAQRDKDRVREIARRWRTQNKIHKGNERLKGNAVPGEDERSLVLKVSVKLILSHVYCLQTLDVTDPLVWKPHTVHTWCNLPATQGASANLPRIFMLHRAVKPNPPFPFFLESAFSVSHQNERLHWRLHLGCGRGRSNTCLHTHVSLSGALKKLFWLSVVVVRTWGDL